MTNVPQLHVGNADYTNGVTMFGVWTAARGVRGLDTGAGAQVSAAERAGSPVVGELVLSNEGPRAALLLDGELVEGGWQHRTLVHDVVLGPRSSRVVEVACVEQGRWSGSAAHRRRARQASPTIRASLRQDPHTRQGAVWSRVQRYQQTLTPSPTASLLDHLDGTVAVVPAARPLPGQRGVLLGVGGQPLVLEMFGSTKALSAHLPALLAAVSLDAALVPRVNVGAVPGRRARRMTAFLDGLALQCNPGHAGDGTALAARTSHADLNGIAMPTGELAHLSVLNTHHPLLEMT